jgi:hypothetical protein
MKTCPNCNTIMQEVHDHSQVATEPILPQQPAEPKITGAPRVRSECPNCHHIEEGYPLGHGAWDKSDAPTQT